MQTETPVHPVRQNCEYGLEKGPEYPADESGVFDGVRGCGLMVFARLMVQQAFKQQSRRKPAGGIVQANHAVHIPSVPAVIPRAEPVPGKQTACEIFGGKDDAHIGETAEPGGFVSQKTAHRGNDGGTAIDGKHPDGSNAFQGKIPAAERAKGCEEDFHAPAGEPAFEKVFCKGCSVVFHDDVSLSF